jgi:hypothetical protein
VSAHADCHSNVLLVYAHVNVGVFTRTPVYPSPFLVDPTFLWMEHLWGMPGRILPGFKVGQIYPYFFFLTVFGGVDYKSLRSTEYDYS